MDLLLVCLGLWGSTVKVLGCFGRQCCGKEYGFRHTGQLGFAKHFHSVFVCFYCYPQQRVVVGAVVLWVGGKGRDHSREKNALRIKCCTEGWDPYQLLLT